MIIPNVLSWVYDFKESQKMSENCNVFPVLNLVTQKTHLPDLKSIIVDDEKLFVMMTSLRPKLKHSGKEMEGKKDDTKRIIVENSQIY